MNNFNTVSQCMAGKDKQIYIYIGNILGSNMNNNRILMILLINMYR